MPDNHPNDRKVYALGETVLDLVSDGGYTMRVIPGGSVLNASVSLGRMGIEVHLLSEFGADKAGILLMSFLKTIMLIPTFASGILRIRHLWLWHSSTTTRMLRIHSITIRPNIFRQ